MRLPVALKMPDPKWRVPKKIDGKGLGKETEFSFPVPLSTRRVPCGSRSGPSSQPTLNQQFNFVRLYVLNLIPLVGVVTCPIGMKD
jgi:hypothetical protein